MKRVGVWMVLGALLAGCAGSAPDPGGEQQAKPVSLINPDYPPAVGGTEGWQYHLTAAGDLDGDGAEESLHVTTSAEWVPSSQSWAWDDGHPWHVYVEEADATRTYLFSGWVQLGRLEVGITDGDPQILILNKGGNGVYAYLVRYRGPGQVEAEEALGAPMMRWAWFADPNMAGR